jgi:hypothetical protein
MWLQSFGIEQVNSSTRCADAHTDLKQVNAEAHHHGRSTTPAVGGFTFQNSTMLSTATLLLSNKPLPLCLWHYQGATHSCCPSYTFFFGIYKVSQGGPLSLEQTGTPASV